MRTRAGVAVLCFITVVLAACGHAPTATPLATVRPDFIVLLERVGPSVVHVTTREAAVARGGDDEDTSMPPRRMLPAPENGEGSPGVGLASGLVIDADGYILTNAHVVAGAPQVQVKFPGVDHRLVAEVVGSDRDTDIALLKVDARGLPVARLGRSQRLRAGEWVAAIGSPFGFENTITAGIVSGTGRSLPEEVLVPFIQTDVAINPGNSGGPLLNMAGEVVGINSQIYSRTGGFMGLSFAIPIDLAIDVAKQLRHAGHVRRGRLGIGVQAISDAIAPAFQLDRARGALVTWVDPDSAAHAAGVQPGDVILRFAGQEISDPNMLARLIAYTPPGRRVTIEIWRDGEAARVETAIGATPAPHLARRTRARTALLAP